MTIRNLEFMFNPSVVALVGASPKPGSIGAVLTRNLTSAGFSGDLFLVNPKHNHVGGFKTFADVARLPKTPDLAVIATPPETVPPLIEQLGRRGTRAAVVITGGFGERGTTERGWLQKQLLAAARPHLLRILGPNCLGVMVPEAGLNASCGHVQSCRGTIAFVAQSAAIQTSVLDWATSKGIGFSHFISVGNMADVDFGDLLDYLAAESSAKAILLYIESITHARKFMSAARAAARMKPVVVVKGGRHREGAQAAATHTGVMVGDDAVYNAAFQRAGMLRVMDMQALFDAVETLAMSRPFAGDRLAILTNGGGLGVLATDVLMDKQGRLAQLAPETIARLDQELPDTWSKGNPLDLSGAAPPHSYVLALEALLDDPGVDALLVLNAPSALASSTEAAHAVINMLKRAGGQVRSRGVFTSWLGIDAAREARRLFAANRIPSYQTPSDAVRGFMQRVRFRRSQEMLMETPPSIPEAFTPQIEQAMTIVQAALSENRRWLNPVEAMALLAAYQIPVVTTRIAATPESAAAMAAWMQCAVALKIVSPDITHKSDVGGVALHLATAEAVMERARAMRKHLYEICPSATLEGFALQPMVSRPNARELIVGMKDDAQFGPVILFGQGGTAVEIVKDISLGLPPLNMHLARHIINRTRVYHLLEGHRGQPAADLDAIALTLVKVSQLVCDMGDIAELDINPLFADEQGVLALDASIKIISSNRPAEQRLAIRPYPKNLESLIETADGRTFLLRPIQPEDEPAFKALFAKLSQEEIRLRFLREMKIMTHSMAARLTQIDYDREMALALCAPVDQRQSEIFGGVRLAADPDNEVAEFAILLRRDMTGKGLGAMLMRRIIDYAKQRGIRKICGDVLPDNRPMLRLCENLGFRIARDPKAPDTVRVSLALQ